MNKLMRLVVAVSAFAASASAFAGTVEDGTAAVPEPGTLGLLVAGLVGVLAVRKFRGK